MAACKVYENECPKITMAGMRVKPRGLYPSEPGTTGYIEI